MAFLGVDVGTRSVRAQLFAPDGAALGEPATEPVRVREPEPGRFEQSFAEIWAAAGQVASRVVSASSGMEVRGVGFDATCSLVVGDDDVIMWCDHRAQAEADEINATGHAALAFVGGAVSLEMQLPKLLWLKRHEPARYAAAAHFLDLTDALTHAATGSLQRSACSLTCKWCWLGPEQGWPADLWAAVGLEDLGEARVGRDVLAPGSSVGDGLTPAAAAHLGGLRAGTPVGAGLIDAHAGALGCLGPSRLEGRLALIAGTSACHMLCLAEPAFVPGVWGPYEGAVAPGLFLLEAGQAAAGAFLDRLVQGHACAPAGGFAELDELLRRDPKGLDAAAVHVLPDVHGNRSPLADPHMRGAVVGLTLQRDERQLAELYLAGLQALAYGTRHILEAVGRPVRDIVVTGGLAANARYLQETADATGLPVAVAAGSAVLRGAAMLGALASGGSLSVDFVRTERVVQPDPARADFHARKYAVFRRMLADQEAYRELMKGVGSGPSGPSG